jgi:hypothetical protein
MVAATADRTQGWTADPGHAPQVEALLVEQLAQATRQLRIQESERRRTDVVRAVVLSLRKTLSWMAEHGSTLDSTGSEFLIKAPYRNGIELWHRGAMLPIETQPLRHALKTAGVELEPGQALLADLELAREVIEESLVTCSLEEFRLRERKSALLRTLVDLPAQPTLVPLDKKE